MKTSFVNDCGERWHLDIGPDGTGLLTGDELGGEALRIANDSVEGDFLFASEEAEWLQTEYQRATGRQLHLVTTADALSLWAHLKRVGGLGK
jgi:hypothetical protein